MAARERERLADAFPSLALDTSQVPARVAGIMWLHSELGFTIDLEIPGNYPRGIPKLWCNPQEIHLESIGTCARTVSLAYAFHRVQKALATGVGSLGLPRHPGSPIPSRAGLLPGPRPLAGWT